MLSMATHRVQDPLRILLIGNGGREHALAWKLAQSPLVLHIYVAPGNGGTAHGLDKVSNVPIGVTNFESLVAFAREHRVNFVIPGPEAPLVAGVTDYFKNAIPNIKVFGPSKAAATLEGSKAYAKDFMARHHIPTARYQNFTSHEAASEHIKNVGYKVVIKASGLAAGKGVTMPTSNEEAQEALRSVMLDREFGSAGDEVVIEEFLKGEELSFLTFSDGYTIKSLPAAQDHKQIHDGDQGPNTGGMGAYAPTPIATPELTQRVHDTVLQPTVDAMRKSEAAPFVGILFTGFMITKDGPRVLEYNVRFGDPETQTLLPLLESKTDLAEILLACVDGRLDSIDLLCKPESSVTVVAAAQGYPNAYKKGDVIMIKPHSNRFSSSQIFHAGTAFSEGQLRTAGGRVLATTSTASSLERALSQAYDIMSTIEWPGKQHRSDIGHRALKRKRAAGDDNQANGMTYADAGVSITSGNELVQKIKSYVKATARPGASAELGGFGGSFDLHAAGYTESPVLVTGTDGVGTKLKIAQAIGKHDTIGIDLVAMNVNDLVVQGAEPLFFTDVFSCGKLDVEVASSVVKGVCDGCKEANCALIGGETAEMAGMFAAGEYDIVGATTGAIPRGRPELPRTSAMREGDLLLGLSSSGCHSNGYSLIRRMLGKKGLQMTEKAPWDPQQTVGESLLIPTKIYVKPLLALVASDLVKGMAHITGGGLVENIPRMLPDTLAAALEASSWPCPPVLQWLKQAGAVSDQEFARVFNTGLGMVLVVDSSNKDKVMQILKEHNESVYHVGGLVKREEQSCIISRMDVWNH